jgi:D-sedoheptulose 7-phosphate isomerase
MNGFIADQLRESMEVKQLIFGDSAFNEYLRLVCERCVEVYRTGRKTLIAGNGGSAGDAQHIAAEFVGRFYFDRPSLPSMALTTDSSMLTAIGNDYGYQNVFKRQLQAHGVQGDMFIAISTSGKSENILEAVKECQKLGITTVGLTGVNGNILFELCDYCIMVPSNSTPRIQEAHILIGHIICAYVEAALFEDLSVKKTLAYS